MEDWSWCASSTPSYSCLLRGRPPTARHCFKELPDPERSYKYTYFLKNIEEMNGHAEDEVLLTPDHAGFAPPGAGCHRGLLSCLLHVHPSPFPLLPSPPSSPHDGAIQNSVPALAWSREQVSKSHSLLLFCETSLLLTARLIPGISLLEPSPLCPFPAAWRHP